MSNSLKEYYKINEGTFTGKKHSNESKLKMSESCKGNGIGNTNSQFGTCWITNEKINKKIKTTNPIPKGWKKGRFLKKSRM